LADLFKRNRSCLRYIRRKTSFKSPAPRPSIMAEIAQSSIFVQRTIWLYREFTPGTQCIVWLFYDLFPLFY